MNADTAAGEIAAAFSGSTLVFLTDVAGVLDGGGELVETLTVARAGELRHAGTLGGGMIPKVEACLRAAGAGCRAAMVDGRQPHALRSFLTGAMPGTRAG